MSDKNWIRVTIESKFYGSRTSVTEQSNLTPEKGEDGLTPQDFVYYPLSKALSSFVSARLREELVEYGKEELARRDTITDLVEEMIEILEGYSLIDREKLSRLLKFLSRENSPVQQHPPKHLDALHEK